MKHINEYLSNKIKDNSYINNEFPNSTDFDDIIDWFYKNDFVDISDTTKTKNFVYVYQQFENIEINKKRFKIKNDCVWFCNSGKISENNPLFNFTILYNGKIDYFKMTTTGIFKVDKEMDFEDFKTQIDKYIN